MAIATDAFIDTGSAFSSATSKTWSHTCTGSNLILFEGHFITVAADRTTGVTYAGSAMTRVNTIVSTPTTQADLWYIIAPSTGANNIVISFSASSTCSAASGSYTGAKQSSQPDASNTGTVVSGTTLAVSTTTVADNSWVLMYVREDAGLMTVGANTTYRSGYTAYGSQFVDRNLATTPAGSVTLNMTLNATTNAGGLTASIAPFVVAATTGPAMLLTF